jgi:outer membrane receptor protein involved in Fe transport
LWSPRNVGDVLSRGIELEAKWSGFSGHLQLGIQSTLSEAVKRSEDYPGDATEGKQLLYVPPQTVRVEAEVRLGSLAAYCSYLHVSHRYTTETNDRFLPSYGVTSAAIRWEFGGDAVRFHMKAEGTNLFDTSYQVIAQYPMPLRSFRFSSGIAF